VALKKCDQLQLLQRRGRGGGVGENGGGWPSSEIEKVNKEEETESGEEKIRSGWASMRVDS